MNKWHVISVTWSNKGENLSNCWSNGEKLTFTTGNVKGSDHCYIGDFGRMPDWKKYVGDFGIMPGWSETHLTGCIDEIIDFHRSLTDKETSYIHQYFMTKWGSPDTIINVRRCSPSVVHPCLHGAVRHCQIQNNLVIRSKNDVAIVQCGQH